MKIHEWQLEDLGIRSNNFWSRYGIATNINCLYNAKPSKVLIGYLQKVGIDNFKIIQILKLLGD